MPVAEYRPASSTLVVTIAPDGTVTPRFGFDDHLGLLAPRPDGLVVAGTWGSRTLLLLDRAGTVIARVDNPQHVVDYQDATVRADGSMLATGTGGAYGRDLGVGDLVAWPSLVTHPHGGAPVTAGVKYGLTVWFALPG